MTCERSPEMSGHQDYKDQGSPPEEAGTKVFTMDYGTGQEVTIPTADAVVDPPDGLKAWCLVFLVMILACLRGTFIELMPQVLLFMGRTNSTSSGAAGHIEIFPVLPVDAQTVDNTYKALYSVSVITSCILTILTGYRSMALIGSFLTAVGYLGAAFCDISNIYLISFLYGALPGFGNLLLEYSLPLFLGEENVAIGAAIMISFQAIGKLSMPAIADEIEKSTKDVTICFYFAGVIFFLSASAIVLAYRLHLRVAKWVVVPDNPDKKPIQEPVCTGVVTERF